MFKSPEKGQEAQKMASSTTLTPKMTAHIQQLAGRYVCGSRARDLQLLERMAKIGVRDDAGPLCVLATKLVMHRGPGQRVNDTLWYHMWKSAQATFQHMQTKCRREQLERAAWICEWPKTVEELIRISTKTFQNPKPRDLGPAGRMWPWIVDTKTTEDFILCGKAPDWRPVGYDFYPAQGLVDAIEAGHIVVPEERKLRFVLDYDNWRRDMSPDNISSEGLALTLGLKPEDLENGQLQALSTLRKEHVFSWRLGYRMVPLAIPEVQVRGQHWWLCGYLQVLGESAKIPGPDDLALAKEFYLKCHDSILRYVLQEKLGQRFRLLQVAEEQRPTFGQAHQHLLERRRAAGVPT